MVHNYRYLLTLSAKKPFTTISTTEASTPLGFSGALGEWESYTRGLGSRLMARMGWQGGGLGKGGQGRVEPVPATLYPQGKSLDWCMERR